MHSCVRVCVCECAYNVGRCVQEGFSRVKLKQKCVGPWTYPPPLPINDGDIVSNRITDYNYAKIGLYTLEKEGIEKVRRRENGSQKEEKWKKRRRIN